MTDHAEHLNLVQSILWAARMDAGRNKWHLDKRAVPRLTDLADEADEPRLHQAAAEAAKASAHFATAQDALLSAIGLVETCAPAPPGEGEPR